MVSIQGFQSFKNMDLLQVVYIIRTLKPANEMAFFVLGTGFMEGPPQ